MSLLLAIDPGVVTPGAAVFDLETKRLLAARYFKGPGFATAGLRGVVDLALSVTDWLHCGDWDGADLELAMEWPQVYGGGRSGGRKDPNDLLPLAAFNGVVAALCDFTRGAISIAHYTPHEWKGSKKKNPTARMVLDRLEHQETMAVEDIDEFVLALDEAGEKECKHPTMNAIDAVGVGLHHLGRLGRKRVISR